MLNRCFTLLTILFRPTLSRLARDFISNNCRTRRGVRSGARNTLINDHASYIHQPLISSDPTHGLGNRFFWPEHHSPLFNIKPPNCWILRGFREGKGNGNIHSFSQRHCRQSCRHDSILFRGVSRICLKPLFTAIKCRISQLDHNTRTGSPNTFNSACIPFGISFRCADQEKNGQHRSQNHRFLCHDLISPALIPLNRQSINPLVLKTLPCRQHPL